MNDELNANDSVRVFKEMAEAVVEFDRALAKALKPFMDALAEVCSVVNNIVTFHWIPQVNYLLTHYEIDSRYVPTPISVAVAEIFAANAPPKFFALN